MFVSFFDFILTKIMRMPFSWKITKFHGKSAYLLDKISVLELIKKLEKHGVNTDVGFKIPSYKYFKFLKTEDFEMLRSYPHLVTSNYGINPVWCLWLTTINGIKMSLYVNLVTQQIIWSKHRFSSKLYQGTIFEGEIVGGKFIIWDLLHPIKDKNGQNMNLHQRISILRGIMDQHYVSDPLIENLPISLKTYVEYPYIRSFIDQYLSQDSYNRGLLFVPVDKSVKCFSLLFNESHQIENLRGHLNQLEDQDLIPHQIKTKEIAHPEEKNEQVQEFWISPVIGFRDNYRIYEWSRTEMFDLGLVAVCSTPISLMLQETFQDHDGISKHGVKNLLKFKCRYLNRFRKWEPFEFIENGV